jgi:hypothetical protein
MPISLRRGRVTAIHERHEGLVRLDVDDVPCIAYPRLTGPVAVGDDVLVNVQARVLRLGSGGFDVLHANLTRGLSLAPEDDAHVMKLPYTPLQSAVRHLEEDGEPAETLAGMPVVCSTLHSQLAPICAALGEDVAIAFLQLPGGALPVSLSDSIRALKRRFRLTTVAVGACVDGDLHAVNVVSALARVARFADVAVCGVGPGIVGTGSRWGHGAVAAAEAANAATALGGAPVLAVRVSEVDARERHRGVSHHARAAFDLCLGSVVAAWPEGIAAPEWLEPRAEVDVAGWREACAGLPLEHMGRGPEEEPAFFAAAYAAGVVARRALTAARGEAESPATP